MGEGGREKGDERRGEWGREKGKRGRKDKYKGENRDIESGIGTEEVKLKW